MNHCYVSLYPDPAEILMHLHTRIMKNIITLAIMATLTLNVSAASDDKKPAKKGTNNKSAIAKFLPDLKLTNEQKPKFAALLKGDARILRCPEE